MKFQHSGYIFNLLKIKRTVNIYGLLTAKDRKYKLMPHQVKCILIVLH